jgi:hypothetical protein
MRACTSACSTARRPSLSASGWVDQARCSSVRMPSRQERRKAERDAAKRAPAQAGAAGAGGATAARANVNVNPVGEWKTQAEDPGLLLQALGAEP